MILFSVSIRLCTCTFQIDMNVDGSQMLGRFLGNRFCVVSWHKGLLLCQQIRVLTKNQNGLTFGTPLQYLASRIDNEIPRMSRPATAEITPTFTELSKNSSRSRYMVIVAVEAVVLVIVFGIVAVVTVAIGDIAVVVVKVLIGVVI